MAAAWLCRAPRPAHVFFTLLTPSIQITFLREAAFLRLATAVKRRLSFSAHFCSHSEKGAMPWAGKREEGDTVQRKRGGRCLAGPCNLAQKAGPEASAGALPSAGCAGHTGANFILF